MSRENEWNVLLRDGSQVDGRVAEADLSVLRSLAQSDNSLLARLYSLCQHDHEPDAELAKKYNQVFFVDGKLIPDTLVLLRNAISLNRSNQYEIVSPYEATEDNRNVLETIKLNEPIFEERLARMRIDRGRDDLFR